MVNQESSERERTENARSGHLIAVVACTPSGVIGLNGSMPWKLSSDLKRFKALTMGGTLVMGRKTYDSIGRPLPGRETIVLSRSPASVAMQPLLHWVETKSAALALVAQLARPTFIVGGAEIYRMFFDDCREIWLTRVLADLAGDTKIDIPFEKFELVDTEKVPQTPTDSAPTEFQRWRRKNSVPKF